MEHVKALVVKFIMCLAILLIILGGFYGVSFNDVLTLSIILTGVSYLIGDLFVLPRFENWSATIADFGIAFIIIWAIGFYIIEQNIPLVVAAGVTALFIAAGEYFFHRYMVDQVIDDDKRDDRISRRKLQTEFSSEFRNDRRDNDVNQNSDRNRPK